MSSLYVSRLIGKPSVQFSIDSAKSIRERRRRFSWNLSFVRLFDLS